MATRARALALAAFLAMAGLALLRWCAWIAARLAGSGGLSGPSPADVENVIAGAIRITREAAP